MFFRSQRVALDRASSPSPPTLKSRTAHRADEQEANQVAASVANFESRSRRISAVAQNDLHRFGSKSEAAQETAARAAGSGGVPLAPGEREFYETQFGHDFSKVRVHADRTAAEAADELGASAYTLGEDIVFAQGEYGSQTRAARMLLAHELTHVVQQRGAAMSVMQRQPADKDQPEKNNCASWESDIESFAKHAADHYLSNDIGKKPALVKAIFHSPATPVVQVDYDDGEKVNVTPKFQSREIFVRRWGPTATSPRCIYTYDCDAQGQLVLTKKSCTGGGGLKPGGGSGVASGSGSDAGSGGGSRSAP